MFDSKYSNNNKVRTVQFIDVNTAISIARTLSTLKSLISVKFTCAYCLCICIICFLGCVSGKEPTSQCRRWKKHLLDPCMGKIPWRSAWQQLQYSRLENSIDRGAWATFHRVTKESDMIFPVHQVKKPLHYCKVISLQLKEKKKKKKRVRHD